MRRTILVPMLAGLMAVMMIVGAAQAEAPQPSIITLGDGGWSWPAGTWDPATRTAVLTQDLQATVRIAGDNITLDGNGYKTVGNGSGDGVYLLGRTGVTIKNLKVKKFTNGIHVCLGGGNTITGITAENNNCGIWVINSKGNTVADNVADNNSYQGILVQGAAGNRITGNSACGNIFGIWLAGSSENTLAGNTASGNGGCGFWLMGSANNTLAENTANGNIVFGVHLQGCSGNTLTGNTVNDNAGGIRAMGSQNNNFTNNTVVNSGTGIYLQGCGGHVISGNTLERNKVYGINFLNAGGSTISGNTVTGNGCGLYFWNSSNNEVFNNNFIDNAVQARAGIGSGNVFDLPKPVGGNYWSNWTSPDVDGDGFVDNPYVLNRPNRLFYGQDTLPWTTKNGWLAASAAPVTTIELSGVSGNNGWYVSDVRVTLTAEGSGLITTEYSFNGADWTVYAGPFTLTEEGYITIYYRSRNGSNVEDSPREQAVKIDKTAPEVTISTPADGSEFILNQNVVVEWSAADAVSGVAAATGTLPTGEVLVTTGAGANVFYVTAEDNAGNVVTITNNYYVRYVFIGFLPPIDNGGGSTFKLGSTVPVKFRLLDAAENTVAGVNARLYLSKLTDGVVGEETEAVSNGKAGDNLFRYAAEDEQYILNLVTKHLLEGTWRIRADIGDGTSRHAVITLRDK